jgi:hypothetical protein
MDQPLAFAVTPEPPCAECERTYKQGKKPRQSRFHSVTCEYHREPSQEELVTFAQNCLAAAKRLYKAIDAAQVGNCYAAEQEMRAKQKEELKMAQDFLRKAMKPRWPEEES